MREPVEGENLDQYGNRKLEDLAERKDKSMPWSESKQEQPYKQGRETGR